MRIVTCLRVYNKVGRTYLFELDFYYLHTSPSDGTQDDEEWQAKYVMDAYHAGNVSPMSYRIAVANLNLVHSFFGTSMTEDAGFLCHHIFKQNHSCEPNCAPNACYVNEGNIEKPVVALFTRRDVLPWEELSFSYTGYESDEEVCSPFHHILSLPSTIL